MRAFAIHDDDGWTASLYDVASIGEVHRGWFQTDGPGGANHRVQRNEARRIAVANRDEFAEPSLVSIIDGKEIQYAWAAPRCVLRNHFVIRQVGNRSRTDDPVAVAWAAACLAPEARRRTVRTTASAPARRPTMIEPESSTSTSRARALSNQAAPRHRRACGDRPRDGSAEHDQAHRALRPTAYVRAPAIRGRSRQAATFVTRR